MTAISALRDPLLRFTQSPSLNPFRDRVAAPVSRTRKICVERPDLAPGSILRKSQEGAMTSIIKDSTAATPLASHQRPLLYGLQLLLRRIPGLQRRIGARPSLVRNDTECSHDGTSPACAACISVYIHMP